jgi:hypothetical protein
MSQETRQQYEERIAGYITKGVSGGKDGNPPDRYAVVQLTNFREDNENAINILADQGFRFEAVLPFDQVLMGNYKENK